MPEIRDEVNDWPSQEKTDRTLLRAQFGGLRSLSLVDLKLREGIPQGLKYKTHSAVFLAI